MTYKDNIIILGCKHWEIKDEYKSGVTIHYLANSNVSDTNEKGYTPVKKSISVEKATCLLYPDAVYPMIVQADFEVKATVKGMTLEIIDLLPIGNIPISFEVKK